MDADDIVCYKRVEELLFFSSFGPCHLPVFFIAYLSLGFGLVIGNGKDNGRTKRRK